MTVRPIAVPGGAVPSGVKAIVALLFATLFFFGLQAPAAHATGPFDMTLNVTTKAGTPLAGLSVYAYPIVNHAIVGDGIIATPGVGVSKTYTFTGANSNALDNETDYAFYFDAPSTATTAFDQFYGGTTFVEEAKYWHYITDQTTLDVTLATNSTFTGKVTGTSNKALAGVAVYPWRFDGNRWFRLDNAKALTNSAGVYTMRDLEPGTYRLEFAPSNLTGYLSEFSGNTPVFGSAGAYSLGLGATVTSNATLAVGGSLSGSVRLTDLTHGEPVHHYVEPSGLTAYAYALKPGGALDTDIPAYPSRQTTATGKWTIPGLPAGQYKVKIYDTLDPDAPEFLDRWSVNADHAADAKIYTVLAGKAQTEPLVTTMPWFNDAPNTSLLLKVLDAHFDPMPDGAEVFIVPTSGEDFSAHFILDGGQTTFRFVPAGTYQVYVDAHDDFTGVSITNQVMAASGGTTWNLIVPTRDTWAYNTPAQADTPATMVGTTYTIDRGNTSLDDGASTEQPVTYSYIWLRDDAPIFGAQSTTSDTYTSRGVDFGHKLSVIVRADTFGYQPIFSTVVLTNSVSIGAAAVSDPSRPPYISGPADAVPGSVLTANVGGWNASGLTFTYQWYRGGSPIAGATNRAYTVQPLDAETYISFLVTASRVGHNPGGEASDDSVYVNLLPALKQTKPSSFTVTAIAGGERITATPGTWSPVPTSYEYDWLIGGHLYDGTSSPVFDCTAATTPDPCSSTGLAIQVYVSGRRDGYLIGEKLYTARKGTELPATDPAHLGFAFDSTDGGHPSFDNTTDPAYVSHILQVSNPSYTYPGLGHDGGTLALTYQWQRKTGSTWANISGATHQTYAATTSDVGHELRIRLTTTSTLYPTFTEYLTAGTGKALQDLVLSPAGVSVDGTDDIGTLKFAGVGAWPVSGVTQTYQWFICDPATASDCTVTTPGLDWKAIQAATKSTYTPTLTGRYLLVQVVGSKSGYTSTTVRSASRQFFAVDMVHPANTTYLHGSQATITAGIVGGKAAVGRTLTAKPGAVDRTTGVTRLYTWRVCNNASAGSCTDQDAHALTATPTSAWFAIYATPYVQFKEVVSLNETPQFQGFSALYPLVLGTNAATVAPKVTMVTPATTPPTYQVTGAWPVGTVVTYTWYDGATTGDTDANFQPPAGTNPIVVEVTATRSGYATLHYTLSARKGTFAAQPTAITSSPSGANRYGDTLTANSFFIPAFGSTAVPKFQWYSGSTAISGKTTNSFVPGTAYIGKALKVRVTLSSPLYNTLVYYTPAVVLGSHLAATGTPVVVTSLPNNAPGSKLTANLSSFPAGMTYTYTWQRSINGSTWTTAGTASSYMVALSDLNKYIRVVVVAKRTGWATSSSIASAPVTVGYLPAIALAAPFHLVGSGLDGTGKVDSPLSISTAWNTTGLALSYTWTRNGVTIPGATGTTVTPTASWIGDEVQAHISATKAGYVPVTVHSNEVLIGDALAPTGSGVTYSSTTKLVSPGVWTAAGLTFTYHWYAVADTARSSELYSGSSGASVPAGDYTVWVDAARAGYATGHASIHVVIP